MHDPNKSKKQPGNVNEPAENAAAANDISGMDPEPHAALHSMTELSLTELQSVELKGLEAQLCRLRPRTDRLDRDRLLFLAGQAAAEHPKVPREPNRLPGWAWPTSFVGMTSVAAALLCMLVMRPESQVVERLVFVGSSVETSLEHTLNDKGQRTVAIESVVPPRSEASRAWTAGQLLHGGEDLLASLPLSDANAAESNVNADVREQRAILSSRSFDVLVDEDSKSGTSTKRPKSQRPQSRYTQPAGINS